MYTARSKSLLSKSWMRSYFIFDNQKFIDCLQLNPQDKLFNCWLLVLGDPKIAEKYRVKITFGEEPNLLCFDSRVYPVDWSRKEVWTCEEQVGIPEKLMKKFVKLDTKDNIHKIPVRYYISKVS